MAGIDSWAKLRALSVEGLQYTKGIGESLAIALAAEAGLRATRADPVQPEPAWAAALAPKPAELCPDCKGRRTVSAHLVPYDGRARMISNVPCRVCCRDESDTWAAGVDAGLRRLDIGKETVYDHPIRRSAPCLTLTQ